ncbi:MAG: DUF262 domain-containing HNH endonuclease family protein [Fibromonadaceae bacterium]|jgi:uncharacterized protein with ParB-like and HNH nuclease domain|nr:DUF262 domain-containing HNH endonuclease family protein [Fibromonadaceae bacterium]
MAVIEVELKTLKKVLNDSDIFYQVPDYQRPYSWDKENVSELVDDLTFAYQNNHSEEYFCGSLVLVKSDRYDIIDGQQRITTFTLLSCVIRDCYSEKLDQKAKDCIDRAIQDEYEENKRKLKFLTSAQMQIDFEETVLKGIKFEKTANPEKTFPNNRYLQNAHYLKHFLDEKLNEYNINPNDFIKWIFEKVALTVLTTNDLDNAIRIFNVLNDRGLPLSPMDILKSRLMQRLSKEDRNAFKTKWEYINNLFKNVDSITFEDMLNTYLYFKLASNPKNRYDKALLEIFENENKNSSEAIFEINEFAYAYLEAIDSNDKYIYMLRYLQHRVYWHSIVATAKYLKYEKYDDLLKVLTAYYYQNWISGATVARIKQTSFNIIKAIKEDKSINDIKTICNDNLKYYNTTTSYENELRGNIYGRKWDKPILLLIEYFSEDDSNNNFIPISNTLQIEHVLPQETSGTEWEQLFDSRAKEVLTNCIGNLTLLSMRKNIQAYNRSFASKKEAYQNKDNVTSSFTITQKILEYSKWDKEIVEKRKLDLIEFINKHLADIFKE